MASIDTNKFSIKAGDTLPALAVTLWDEDDTVADLTDASSVKFRMGREPGRQAQVDMSSAQITDAAGGQVQYNWTADDTAIPGVYTAEFVVTYNSGKVKTFPDGSYLIVSVLAQAGVTA